MKQIQTKKFLYLVLVLIFIGGSIYIRSLQQNLTQFPLTWESCITLPGSVIQESYPARCVSRDGRSVLQPTTVDKSASQPPMSVSPASDYYGSSTLAACTNDTECVVAGCNSEICQGQVEEEGVSICILPEKPTPQQLGYTCSCHAFKCQWYR